MHPALEKSKDWDTTENLNIEGDNLEALKLLRNTYAGKVKMIYIDPPYNMGHDFIYDDFAQSREDYDAQSGDIDEGGRLVANPESNGRFHSNWCSMMYPRLLLARDLLSEDGVIFISIDDNEVWNAKKTLDEAFGSEEFVACVAALNNPRGRNQEKYIATCHESLLIYSRNVLPPNAVSIPKTDDEVASDYPEKENGRRFRLLELRNTHRTYGKFNRPNLYYPFYVSDAGEVRLSEKPGYIAVFPNWSDDIEGCWTRGKDKAKAELSDIVAKRVSGDWKLYR